MGDNLHRRRLGRASISPNQSINSTGNVLRNCPNQDGTMMCSFIFPYLLETSKKQATSHQNASFQFSYKHFTYTHFHFAPSPLSRWTFDNMLKLVSHLICRLSFPKLGKLVLCVQFDLISNWGNRSGMFQGGLGKLSISILLIGVCCPCF